MNLYTIVRNKVFFRVDLHGTEEADKEFVGYVYDRALEGADIYVCETSGLARNRKHLDTDVAKSYKAFTDGVMVNRNASIVWYSKDFSKKVSKVYKVKPNFNKTNIKITPVSQIVGLIYLSRTEKVLYQKFEEAARAFLKIKNFENCFNLCLAMDEYARQFMLEEISKGVVYLLTRNVCLARCMKSFP